MTGFGIQTGKVVNLQTNGKGGVEAKLKRIGQRFGFGYDAIGIDIDKRHDHDDSDDEKCEPVRDT